MHILISISQRVCLLFFCPRAKISKSGMKTRKKKILHFLMQLCMQSMFLDEAEELSNNYFQVVRWKLWKSYTKQSIYTLNKHPHLFSSSQLIGEIYVHIYIHRKLHGIAVLHSHSSTLIFWARNNTVKLQPLWYFFTLHSQTLHCWLIYFIF